MQLLELVGIQINQASVNGLPPAPILSTNSVFRSWRRDWVVICLLVAGCLAWNAGPSLAAGSERMSPGAPSATPAAVGPSRETVPSNSALLQRRRQAIARMLEGSLVYRTLFDVKLINAKLAGPFEYKVRNSLFSSETHIETLYCVRADFDVPWIHAVGKAALIRVVQTGTGSERLHATVSNGPAFACRKANYERFPELEQLRAQRRKALGKSD